MKFIVLVCVTTSWLGCATASPQKADAPVAADNVEGACRRGKVGPCRVAVVQALLEGKLVEAQALAKQLVKVRRSEGVALLDAVNDASLHRDAARNASRKACDAGSVRACEVLAEALISEKRLEEGAALQRHACDLGGGRACAQLATHVVDAGEQERLRRRSCDLKYGKGCFDLGNSIDKAGRAPEASQAFNKGCALGDGDCCAVVASNAYAAGDFVAGRRHGQTACKASVTFGCFLQAMSAERLNKLDEAAKLLTTLCEHDTYACRELGMLQLTLEQTAEARAAFDKGCNGGDVPSCMQLARASESTGQTDEALALYGKLCDAAGGQAEACFAAGLILEAKAAPGLEAQAVSRFTKACAGKIGVGCLKIAFRYEHDRNERLARQWFAAACNLGESMACEMIGNPQTAAAPTMVADAAPLDRGAARKLDRACDSGRLEACWTLVGAEVPAH